MDDYVYNDIIKKISNEFSLEISKMEAIYNFDYGDEFEIALCKILRKFLPLKYGVCRGFVVDKHGETVGDDIIIYDQELYPTLRLLDSKNDYAQKNQIPVEAVYAYIEAKNSLNASTLLNAISQVRNVKKLCYTRSAVPLDYNVHGRHIFNNDYSKNHGWNPVISNPVYSMIVSANCFDINGKKATCGEESTAFLVNELCLTLSDEIASAGIYGVDSIIAGSSTTAFCSHYIFDKNGQKKKCVQNTRFYTGIDSLSCYQVNTHKDIAYGLAIAHLMMALNFIHLGDMPWDMIFNTAKVPDKNVRDLLLESL